MQPRSSIFPSLLPPRSSIFPSLLPPRSSIFPSLLPLLSTVAKTREIKLNLFLLLASCYHQNKQQIDKICTALVFKYIFCMSFLNNFFTIYLRNIKKNYVFLIHKILKTDCTKFVHFKL